MKFSLKDLSICIPIRCDSEDRIINLNTVIQYFEKYFVDFEFIILEEEADNIIYIPENIINHQDVKFEFKSNKNFFHHTRMLNESVKKSNRKFVTTYDVDVLVPPAAWETAINLLNEKDLFVFPYNGVFINVTGQAKENIINTIELPREKILPSVSLYTKYGNEFHVVNNMSFGGVCVLRRETYLKYGGFNEEMKSWGYNDNELVMRFTTLGYSPHRINWPLYHLDHKRGIDSSPNHSMIENNKAILSMVAKLGRKQLIEYINEKLL